jgi:AsmA family protein
MTLSREKDVGGRIHSLPCASGRTNPALVRLATMAAKETSAPAARRVPAALKWAGIAVAGVVVVLLIAAAVLDLNADALRGPLARTASAHLHRAVHLDGRLELHLFSWHPRVVINQLRIANPDWVTAQEAGAAATDSNSRAPGPTQGNAPTDMARIGQLVVVFSIPALFKGDVLLPYLGIDDSDLDLVRVSADKANWSFTNGPSKPSAKPAKFPLLGSLHLGKGNLRVTDEVRKLRFKGTIAADQRANGGPLSLGLNGDGTINGQSFKLAASGDPLITAESHKPYTVTSDIEAGHTKVKSRITITKPFDMGSVVADIDASGDDLADLYYLSGLALPNTSPYTVSTHVTREGSLLKLTDFRGTLGNSDIHGTLSLETARQRPLLTADLSTRSLDIKDLGPTLGSREAKSPSSLSRQQARAAPQSAEGSTAKARKAAPKAAKTGEESQPLNLHGAKPKSAQTRTAEAEQADVKAAQGKTLLPDSKLDLKRIRAMDANVKYRAESVKTRKMNIREIVVDLKLDDGVLSFTPVSFVLPQGKLTTNIKVNGSKDIPEVDIDARVTQVQLSQFKMKGGGEPIDGTLVARAILHGRGKSLHEIGATAQGTLSAVIPHGDIRSAFAELIGIDVVKGLGLVLTGNQDKTAIRCGVANFKAAGGVFAAQDIVFDTDKVLVLGRGEVDLGTEILDLTLTGQPKKFRFFRIKSPVVIHGTLEKPKVGLKPGNTPGEIALATALGVLATPLASVVAFIDPGLAKDANCGALIAEAERQGAHPAKEQSAKHEPAAKQPAIKDAQRSTKARSMT